MLPWRASRPATELWLEPGRGEQAGQAGPRPRAWPRRAQRCGCGSRGRIGAKGQEARATAVRGSLALPAGP